MGIVGALAVVGVAVVVMGCKGPTSAPGAAVPGATVPASPPATPAAPLETEQELPAAARAVTAAELAGDFSCGPFGTKELAKDDQLLLDDRVRVRFVPNATAGGGADSGKLEVERGGVTMFFGAREPFLRGDALFERRAAKTATFGDAYDPLTIPGRDGKIAIVAGFLREAKGESDMVALAHGWFLDPDRNVLDVAVFASPSALKDLKQCRLFAQKILSTVAQGPRRLTFGSAGDVETTVSYAKFAYRLPPDWTMSSSMGIHDFARIHFRKRGVFPKGSTDLEMALDSHPGDWKSPGEGEAERQGRLLGVPVSWHLTREKSLFGAWTVSTELLNRDHAVASLVTSSAEDRDEAIRFAESVRIAR